VTIWGPDAQPKSDRLLLASDEVILARCEREVKAKLVAPVGSTNVHFDPN